MDTKHNVINFLWLDNILTEVELLSLHSFMKLNYECHLWAYEKIENVPKGVIVKDASKIVTLNSKINKTRFSDYFRYKLLFKYGGIWSDLDNICIKSLPSSEYIFPEYGRVINNNLLKFPKQSKMLGEIIKEIEEETLPINSVMYNLEYLQKKVVLHKLEKFIFDEQIFNPFKHDTTIELGLRDIIWSEINCSVVHLFKSTHRVALRESELYKNNLTNLKTFIDE